MDKILQRTRRPDVTFARNGKIFLAANVVHALSLRPGDSINIAFDKGECYLLAVPHEQNGRRYIAQCCASKRGTASFRANSTDLCRALLDFCNITSNVASFYVGEPATVEGELCLPIIYKLPL